MRAETVEAVGGEIVSPEARELLALQLRRHQPHSREYRVISALLRLLRVLDQSIAGGVAAAEAILSVLNAQDWNEVRNAVERNRSHLLPDAVDIAFADLILQPSMPEGESRFLAGWHLIEQGRKVWHEAVPETASRRAYRREFEAQSSEWAGFAEYSAAINALSAPGHLPRRVEVCRAAPANIGWRSIACASRLRRYRSSAGTQSSDGAKSAIFWISQVSRQLRLIRARRSR
jgi:hypothetical protein